MESSTVRNAAEITGIAAILVTLILILLQMRQADVIASAEFNVSLVTAGIETSNLIAENAETWVKGSAGQELTAAEQAVFQSIVASLDTRWFVEHRHMIRLGEKEQADTILHDWAGFMHERPGLRQVWLSRQKSMTDSRELLSERGDRFNHWSDAIEADLARLDAATE